MQGTIGISLDKAKGLFFDKKAIRRAVDKGTRRVLSRFGAFVRTTARRSIRPARQKKLSELTPEEKQRYETRLARHKRGKGPKPKLPKAPSRPGEPPRSQTGVLRKTIFFGYDPRRRSVVIGPVKLGRGTAAPGTLEFGGTVRGGRRRVRIAPRPYMGPAFQQEQPKLARMWKNSVR